MSETLPQRVTFHVDGNFQREKFFVDAYNAKQYIVGVMRGEIVYEDIQDGEPVFIPLHRITGAILHPQPVADD